MRISRNGLDFIAKEEGLVLHAYLDSVGVWTIGYGSTFYEDGTKVKKGDKVSKERAENLLINIAKRFENGVSKALTRPINQNQFDALVSLAFNIGVHGISKSTVIKRVNNNPCDPSIRQAFEMWRFAGGKPILLGRRKREANLYFS